MRTYAALALAATALAAPQGVATGIAPSAPPPPGCKTSYPGQFQITVVNVTSTPKKAKRDPLEITLAGGVLTDAKGRIGAIVANYQFQFDGPPQAGSIYTGGFSVCGNGSLALGGSAIFYQCLSGGFYNLYDRSWAPQCSPIYIQVMGASPAAASQAPDGQPGVITQVSQITDGQVQATPVTQIGDGQIQGPKPMPVTQIGDGQIQGSAVSQISDGQIQAKPTAPKPLSQISDGQVQAPTGKPVAQISDGQIQATPMPMPAPKPVSQITDGQVQAPTGKPVSQISDGQIQAKPSSTGSPVAQITDGQIQVSSTKAAAATPVSSAPAQQTVNAAPAFKAETGALVAGVAAVLALL